MKLTAKLLKKLIQEEVQTEGHYHDMGGEDEMYNALVQFQMGVYN